MNKRGRPEVQCPNHAELAALYSSGLSPYRIAQRMGYSQKAVVRWLAEIGVAHSPKPPREDRCKYATVLVSAVTGKRAMPRLYAAWDNMKKRCSGLYPQYRNSYTAKGIKVCAEWKKYAAFRAWALANGFRKGLSLDRIDGNGNYEPSNCRWATKREQQNNTSRTHILTLNGVTQPLTHWAERLGVTPEMLRSRLRSGWTHEQVLTSPLGKWREGVQHGKRGRRARAMSA